MRSQVKQLFSRKSLNAQVMGYLLVPLISLIVIAPQRAGAQISPEEHASHHPDSDAANTAGVSQDQNQVQDVVGGKGGMMGGGMDMGKMMEKMGAPKPKELYPSLMSLPDLPLEKRDEIQRQAHVRMQDGTVLMADGLEILSRAAPSDNYGLMQEATVVVREGLSRFESGLAAHRALAEGKSPKNVALTWFKREMSLTSGVPMSPSSGVFGLSWFHFFVMVLLSGFAICMIIMYFFKMRRATELLNKLISEQKQQPETKAAVEIETKRPQVVASSASSTEAQTEPLVATSSQVIAKKWSGKLKVARIFQETSDVKTFRFVSEENDSIPFTYLPGQFLTLSVVVGGKVVKRSYTIASSPTQRFYCEITVKCDPQGTVSRYLHEQINEGDSIYISAPMGKFTFSGTESDSIVLIGGGVGITPLMSVVRYLTDSCWGKDIYMLYSCRTSADFIFREELENLQKRNQNLHVIATMTRAEGTVWMGLKGHLNRDVMSGSVPDITIRRVHLCGPPPMMAAINSALKELHVPDNQIKTEAFGPAKKPVQAAKPDQKSSAFAQVKPSGVNIQFQKSEKSASMGDDETILDAAERLGIEIDNSCRSGSCGSCKVKLLSGDVVMECEDGLEADEKAQGMVLACQAIAKNNVTVDA